MTYGGKPYLRKISIASTLIYPDLGAQASVSPIMSLMSGVRLTSASVLRSDENCLSKRKTDMKTIWVPRNASGKVERLESDLRSRGKR
jgi:hypothetical protein